MLSKRVYVATWVLLTLALCIALLGVVMLAFGIFSGFLILVIGASGCIVPTVLLVRERADRTYLFGSDRESEKD